MSGLRLTLRAAPAQRLDLSALTPDRLAGLAEAEIVRLPLATTREAACVGDVFGLRMGDVADIVIEGGSARLDFVGAGMSAGRLRVLGEVGVRAGRGMRGGQLAIDGDADAFAGSGMRGGDIVIDGNAGPFLGGPGPGERAGMAGGSVVVRGHAGPGAGTRMRRGTLVIEGDAGPDAAFAMIAGTLAICGQIAGAPGQLMRRGTLLLANAVSPGPGFVPTGAASDAFLRLFARFLQPLSPRAAALAAAPLRRMIGDLTAEGHGEIFMAGPHDPERGARRPWWNP